MKLPELFKRKPTQKVVVESSESERSEAYILFMDIPKYSRLGLDQPQAVAIKELFEIIQHSLNANLRDGFRPYVLPTGDGACICFVNEPGSSYRPDVALKTATAIAREIMGLPSDSLLLKTNVRMGIHAGPVIPIHLMNPEAPVGNVAGGAINTAQRIMEFGDAKHILLSQRAAEGLERDENYKDGLVKLPREYWGKHDVRLTVYNYADDEVGNKTYPSRGLRPAEAESVCNVPDASSWGMHGQNWFTKYVNKDDSEHGVGLVLSREGYWPKEVSVDFYVDKLSNPPHWRAGIALRGRGDDPEDPCACQLLFHVAPKLSDCRLRQHDKDSGDGLSPNTEQSQKIANGLESGKWHELTIIIDESSKTISCSVAGALLFDREAITQRIDALASVALRAWGETDMWVQFRNLSITWKERKGR